MVTIKLWLVSIFTFTRVIASVVEFSACTNIIHLCQITQGKTWVRLIYMAFHAKTFHYFEMQSIVHSKPLQTYQYWDILFFLQKDRCPVSRPAPFLWNEISVCTNLATQLDSD